MDPRQRKYILDQISYFRRIKRKTKGDPDKKRQYRKARDYIDQLEKQLKGIE